MFEVLDELNQEDSINGTRAIEVGISFVRAKTVKAGAEITMGMPESSLHDIICEAKIPLLLLVDKQEYFKRIESEAKSNYTEKEIEAWKEKARKWDLLNEEIGKCYPELDDDGNEIEEVDADLGTIGEIAATHFGYL